MNDKKMPTNMRKQADYDYLIVGAGLFGALFACEARKAGKRCLVIDKRTHTGGNIHCLEVEGIHVHQYGAHIFHTSNRQVWDYVNHYVDSTATPTRPLPPIRDGSTTSPST